MGACTCARDVERPLRGLRRAERQHRAAITVAAYRALGGNIHILWECAPGGADGVEFPVRHRPSSRPDHDVSSAHGFDGPANIRAECRRTVTSLATCRLLVVALGLAAGCTTPQPRPILAPAAATAIDASPLDAIEPLIRNAIAEKKLPGAVVLVGLSDRTLYHRAIGQRALVPSVEAMTPDTM